MTDQADLADLPRIGVVILNWNLPDQTLACVHALRESTLKADSLLVVDNGSSDESLATFKRALRADELLGLPENVGFAAGMNAGIREMRGRKMDYVLIMNNDICVAPDMLRKLVDEARIDPLCSIAAPVVFFTCPSDKVWHAGSRFGRFLLLPKRVDDAEISQAASTEVDAVPASVWLLSGKAIDKIGVFDTRYFMYYEDWDYCWRARAAGLRILVVGAARAWHAVSASTRSIPAVRHHHFSRGRTGFYLSHGSLYSRLGMLVGLALSDAQIALNLLLEGQFEAAGARLRGFVAGIALALDHHSDARP